MQIPVFDKHPIDTPATPEAWEDASLSSNGWQALAMIFGTVVAGSFIGTALALWMLA